MLSYIAISQMLFFLAQTWHIILLTAFCILFLFSAMSIVLLLHEMR